MKKHQCVRYICLLGLFFILILTVNSDAQNNINQDYDKTSLRQAKIKALPVMPEKQTSLTEFQKNYFKTFSYSLNPCEQSTPISFQQIITGTLSLGDCQISDGSYIDFYSFNAFAGDRVTISLTSSQFDTFLYLLNQGSVLAYDDNGGGGGNSLIQMGLPVTGQYLIGANSFTPNALGNYNVSVVRTSTVTRPVFDFDGDGKSDISIFRPSGGEWWINRSSTNVTVAAAFGSSSDKLVPGDYTGDGKADIAFWRPSNGNWYILRSEDASFYGFPFGTSGDIPVAADFDGDGKTDQAVFRPSNSGWYIQKSTGGVDSSTFGTIGDSPVVADYDGDGKADIAITRSNGVNREWWIRRSSNGQVFSATFGESNDKAVQGDYTGDGKADMAFWRPSSGYWYILRSEDFSFYGYPFGSSGDVPVPADYDGDGKIDASVFRPSNSGWYLFRSSQGSISLAFGTSGDIPIPSVFIP